MTDTLIGLAAEVERRTSGNGIPCARLVTRHYVAENLEPIDT